MSDFLRIVNGYQITQSNVDEARELTQKIQNELDRRKDQITNSSYAMAYPDMGQPMTLDGLRGIQSNATFASFAVSVLAMLEAKPYAIMYGPRRQHKMLPYLKEKSPG